MTASFRLFLSSPGDVADERKAADRVVKKLNAESDEPLIDIILWEETYYTADSTFQDQIPKPSECDLVVCVFWKRLGSELPDAYRRPDGTIPTGTEYEFEDALHHATHSDPKTPDVLVYRKTAPVTFQEDTLELEKAQRDNFLSFWKRWFFSEQGHFVAAFQSFEKAKEFEEMLEKHLRGWLDNKRPKSENFDGSPFRGLDSYTIDDADCFFGRDREIQRARARFLVNASTGQPVLFLIGTSGSGKSSLLRAGVLAHFRRPGTLSVMADEACIVIGTPAGLSQTGDWADGLATVLLSSEPLASALSNGDFGTTSALAELLRNSPASAKSVLTRALDRASAETGAGHRQGLLIAIDQLEEAFNYDAEALSAFAACLLALSIPIDPEAPRIGLIFGMRSDYRHVLVGNPDFTTLAGFTDVKGPDDTDRILEIAQPRAADLRDIILGPAKLAGLTYEVDPGTNRDLTLEIEEQALQNSLPALQLLLTELYKQRDDTVMTLAAFDALGGLGGVVAQVAETAFRQMPPSEQAALPRVLRALSVHDPDTPKPRARRLASDTFAADTPEQHVIAQLSDARLILNDGETMRIAHECLFDAWPRAADLLEQNRRFSQLRDRLGRRAIAFDAASKTDAKQMLLTGFDLNESRELLRQWGASELADTYPSLPGFLQASIRAARNKLLRSLIGGVSVTLVLLSLGAAAWLFDMQANEAAQRAQVSFQLAKANASLRAGDRLPAVQAALAAYDLENSTKTRSVLAETLSAISPYYLATLRSHRYVAIWQGSKQVRLFGSSHVETWDADTFQRSMRTERTAPTPLIAVSAGGDAAWIGLDERGAITDHSGQTRPFDQEEVDLIRAAQADSVQTEDGVHLIAFADEFAGAWASQCSAPLAARCETVQVLRGQTTALAWSDDAARLLVTYVDDAGKPQAAVFDRAEIFGGGAQPRSFATGTRNEAWLSVTWIGTDMAALAGRSGTVTFAQQDAAPRTIALGDAPITSLAWTPTAQILAATCGSQNICLLDPDGTQIATLYGHTQPVTRVAFSPDGTRLLSEGDQNETMFWSLAQNTEVLSFQQIPFVTRGLAFAARDGKWIYGDVAGNLVSGPDSAPAPTVIPSGEGIAHLALGPNGALAAVDRNGGLAIWHNFPLGTEPDLWLPDQDARRLIWWGTGDLAFVTRSGAVGTLRISDGSNTVATASLAERADGLTALGTSGFATSHVGGGLYLWPTGDLADASLLNGAELGPEDLSAFSMSATPFGDWLTATRGDNQLIVYNVTDLGRTVRTTLLRRNSKASLFSPGAARLAALDAEGMLYVWDFDTATGTLRLQFFIRTTFTAVDNERDRQRVGLDWRDSDNLAIAFGDGSVYTLNVRPQNHAVRARTLLSQNKKTLLPLTSQ